MSLPITTGRGFLISDGIELKFSQSGTAWARLPLSFKHRVKQGEEWVDKDQILVEAKVFGPLAEYLSENVTGRQEIDVTGTIYTSTWVDKNGVERSTVAMNVSSAQPVEKREYANAAPRRQATSQWGGGSIGNDDVPF